MADPTSHAAASGHVESPEHLLEQWRGVPVTDQAGYFRTLSRQDAGILFLALGAEDRAAVLSDLTAQERRVWLRLLEPDDAADLLQAVAPEDQREMVELLDSSSRAQVEALLAYERDVAGGKMSPRYVQVAPTMTVEEAIAYLRLQGRAEIIYYAYVLDEQEHLLGVVSYRDLIMASASTRVADVMTREVVSVHEEMDQEEVAEVMRVRGLVALPVVDSEQRMHGIVTVDDVLLVQREEATEDIQKIGGLQALRLPYFRTPPLSMLRKRGGWLSILFVGQMLTVSAMAVFEDDLQQAAVLAVFIPLIISSGGNSGSQASTLVIRSMALGEIRLGDWWRVIQREVRFGLALGAMLAALGGARIVLWESLFGTYGDQFLALGVTVALSVVAVVTWGTITGATLPFILRRTGLDPATASAPLVATLVDVTGLLIYLSLARVILLT